MTRYQVTHRTDYRYGVPVTSGQTIAHLLVRETPHQHVLHADVEVVPAPDHRHTHIDGFGNLVSYLALQHPHEHLTVTSNSEVEVVVPAGPGDSPAWDETAGLLAGDTTADGLLARQCALDSPLVVGDDVKATGRRRRLARSARQPAPETRRRC